MNKTIYLVRGVENESYTDFSGRILKCVNKVSGEPWVQSLKLVYTIETPPMMSIIPFKKSKIASISVYQESFLLIQEIMQLKGFSGAYQVEEALPVAYQKTWDDLELTPGICLLTLFNRKPGIDRTTFLDRWHNSHTPMSLKFHPLWNYSRNVVEKLLTENSQPFEGIVEEQTRTDSELLNPFKFFGSPMVIIPRMLAVYRDTNSFLDYKRIETYLAREVVVRS